MAKEIRVVEKRINEEGEEVDFLRFVPELEEKLKEIGLTKTNASGQYSTSDLKVFVYVNNEGETSDYYLSFSLSGYSFDAMTDRFFEKLCLCKKAEEIIKDYLREE